MGEIYSNCEEVLIWLGEVAEGQRPLQELELLQDISHLSDSKFLQSMDLIEIIFLRPWFNRLWVLQEAVLAPKGTVALGRERWSLSVFSANSRKLFNLLILFTTKNVYIRRTSGIGKSLNRIIEVDNLRIQLVRKQFNHIGTVLSTMTKSRDCKDPRDHIYGLAGILRRSGLEIDIDYGKPPVEVFVDFTMKNLLDNFNHVFYVRDFFGRSSLMDLPSWAPDFGGSSGTSQMIRMYTAGGSSNCSIPRISTNGSILKVPGFEIDRIITRSKDCRIITHETTRSWVSEVEDLWLQHVDGRNAYGDWDAAHRAFVATLVADLDEDNDMATKAPKRPVSFPKDNYALEVLLGRAMPWPGGHSSENVVQSLAEEEIDRYKTKLAWSLRHRILMFTEHGYIGVAPQGSQVGDIVVVVPGLNMPMILRERTEDNTFEYIGLAYVHGIMDGESVADAARKEIQPQIFSIT
jgi:hypothetical protein